MRLVPLILVLIVFAGYAAHGQPNPGTGLPALEMIDVGGRKMEVYRAGRGGPTVVFETGIVTPPQVWTGIQPRVAEFAETLSYSHLGLGKSAPAAAPRSASQIAAELRALLRQADTKPPYVLVGQSMGGLYARVFAINYPTEVAGLVMVDAVHERQVLEFVRVGGESASRRRQAALDTLDPAQRAEMSGLAPILEQSGTLPGKVPDVPMAVVTSLMSTTWVDGTGKLWRDLHDEMFRITSYGMHIVTSKSGHAIQKDEPDLVVNAIRWVVDAARTRVKK